MRLSPHDQWIALHTQYYVQPDAKHSGLMMDANLFLDSAHGMAQALGDAIGDSERIDTEHLCSALNGIALLVEIGRRCVAQADRRMMRKSIERAESL